jgi:hypothetical protein
MAPGRGAHVLGGAPGGRGSERPPVGPEVVAVLRCPGTAAPKRRPVTGWAIDEALKAIGKGLLERKA